MKKKKPQICKFVIPPRWKQQKNSTGNHCIRVSFWGGGKCQTAPQRRKKELRSGRTQEQRPACCVPFECRTATEPQCRPVHQWLSGQAPPPGAPGPAPAGWLHHPPRAGGGATRWRCSITGRATASLLNSTGTAIWVTWCANMTFRCFHWRAFHPSAIQRCHFHLMLPLSTVNFANFL